MQLFWAIWFFLYKYRLIWYSYLLNSRATFCDFIYGVELILTLKFVYKLFMLSQSSRPKVKRVSKKMANFYLNTEKRKEIVDEYGWKNIWVIIGSFLLFFIAIGGFSALLFLYDHSEGENPYATLTPHDGGATVLS